MKILTASAFRFLRGNVLITALVFGAVVSIVLASYLTLVKSRTLVRARSFAWNSAIPVLEGGIEEAFEHLHHDSANLAANQWTSTGTNSTIIYRKSWTNADSSYYVVALSNVATAPITAPIIYSRGFVRAPLGRGYISRYVQVCALQPQNFSKAIAARSTVTLSGGATVDSFDSSNTNYSTAGKYDPAKQRGNGGVVTGSSAHPAISASGGHIYGLTDTGPGGTVTVSGSATIGELGWTTGIEPGYANDDFNFSYSDPPPPATNYTSWFPPVFGLYPVAGTNYTYKLGNLGYYQLTDFTISGGQSMIVTGKATFYVAGKITVSGSGFIYIAPGGSLNLYGGGISTTISGGGVANGTGYAANFSYYGMTNNITVTYSGSSSFIGTINAPHANFTLSGSAAMSGAAIVNSFNDSGGASIHYDEGLSALAPFVLTSYREL